MADTDDVAHLKEGKGRNRRKPATDQLGLRPPLQELRRSQKMSTIDLTTTPSIGNDQALKDYLPDLTIDDYRDLVRLSTAKMGCFDFSTPIAVDLPPQEFVRQIYGSKSQLIDGSLAFVDGVQSPSVDAAIGLPLSRFFPLELGYSQLFLEWYRNRLSRESFDVSVSQTDGSRGVYQVVAYAKIRDSAIHRIWFVLRDITAQAQSVAQLAQAERHYRALVERPGLVLGRIMLDETAEYFSPSLAEMTGVPIQKLKESPSALTHFVHPEDLSKIDELYSARLAGSLEALNVELRMRVRDGEYHAFYVRQSPMISSQGTVEFYDLLAIDIQRHKELEQEVQRNAQVALVGQLAAGISHDFNNYLTAILGQIEGALSHTPETSPAHAGLVAARNGTQACAHMATQLRNLGKGSSHASDEVNLNEVVHEVCTLVSRVVPTTITLRVSTSPQSLITKGDRVQLQQVIINLILNARDAMPDGGVLTISVAPTAAGASSISESTLSDKSAVLRPTAACISVQDTGMGVPKATIPHIFRPFFSTKSLKGGSGLGLSMVRTIVEAHDGWFDFMTEESRGSTFSVFLPIYRSDATLDGRVIESSSPATPCLAPRTIAIAEDDEMIRTMLSTALRSMGCTVEVFENGLLLLKHLSENTSPCDMIVLDDSMPKARGVELLEQVRRLQPHARLVLTSGDPAVKDDPCLQLLSVRFLAKPFPLGDLVSLIED